MINVYTTAEYLSQLQEWIQSEYRLEELVRLVDMMEERPHSSGLNLLVRGREITNMLDWDNSGPPYLLPREIRLTTASFLGLLFVRLNNLEKAHEYLSVSEPALWREIVLMDRLRQGFALDPNELSAAGTAFDDYRLLHNQAIVRHYAAAEETFDLKQLEYFYREALAYAFDDEHWSFTALHFAGLLSDMGRPEEAEKLLTEAIDRSLTIEGETALKAALCGVWMQRLTVPYDDELLAQLKETLWSVLQVYESQEREVEVGLLLLDAARVATISESFAEALGYTSRAADIFETAGLTELCANAHYQKGMLLYTWAQNGNPQFYRPAAESLQEALKVFKRENAPAVFAEIQQYLGIIYAEIPDEAKKKSIWAAVSSSSFQEALQYYTEEDYPYEYAMVCNHYGNALTKYPAALHTDNHEKALFFYQKALDIRQAEKFPMERAMTLLNYLEAAWHRELASDELDEKHYEDMRTKATEVLSLTEDEGLRADAQRHLDKLAELRRVYATTS